MDTMKELATWIKSQDLSKKEIEQLVEKHKEVYGGHYNT